MSERETTEEIVDPEERKKLIQDIANIKDVLDSYKYGLNFEEFADSLFKTIDRQTIAVNQLKELMISINERMEKLESRLDEGIKVRVRGLSSEDIEGNEEVILDKPEEPEEIPVEDDSSHDELRAEKKELETKIGRLFEKENELTEMALNDPASADEYEEKAKVAKDMRISLEERLKEIKETLEE